MVSLEQYPFLLAQSDLLSFPKTLEFVVKVPSH